MSANPGPATPPTRVPLERLNRESFVFRLVPLKDVFLPNGPDGLPTYEAFRPTRQDEREAEARGRPVLVSVWEHGVTTVEQASTLRRADAERDGRIPGESLPRWLATADIEDASAERLRVLHDPRPE